MRRKKMNVKSGFVSIHLAFICALYSSCLFSISHHKVIMTENEIILDDGFAIPMSVKNQSDIMEYLNKFGYMDDQERKSINDMNSQSMKLILRDFQRFMGLTETGKVNKETLKMMNMPRCGVADNILARRHRIGKKKSIRSEVVIDFNDVRNERTRQTNHKRRFKRFQLQGSAWSIHELTWKITSYSSRNDLQGKEERVKQIMNQSLNEWSKHTTISFIEQSAAIKEKPSIEIRFTSGNHHDGNPFDGPGKVLAHAFFPNYGGDTHFDDQEKWVIDGGKGIDLFSVAIHEFGHALGLGHSDIKDSIMFPTYVGTRRYLEEDDIKGVQMLYGKRKPEVTKTPEFLDQTPNINENFKSSKNMRQSAPDLCHDFKIDAAECMTNGECFFFRDQFVWKINTDTSIAIGYPKLIADVFPGLTGKIDAVLTDDSLKRTYFFKNDKLWAFERPMHEPLLKNELITDVIPELNIDNINAATQWGFDGKMYLFKNDAYWRYDSQKIENQISARYTTALRLWHGIPNDVDAAMFWPKTGRTYFFKGEYYYRFNDATKSIDDANPSFPRKTSRWWLKCNRKMKLKGKKANLKAKNSISELTKKASNLLSNKNKSSGIVCAELRTINCLKQKAKQNVKSDLWRQKSEADDATSSN